MAYYIQLNEEAYLTNGEILLEGSPMTFHDIIQLEDEISEREPYSYYGVHHMKEFFELINVLGGKRGEFISFLLKNKNTQNQITNRSRANLAKEAGVSIQTVTDAIKIMRKHGLLKSSTMTLMINPFLDRKGDRKREALLMNLYSEFVERGRKEEVERKEGCE